MNFKAYKILFLMFLSIWFISCAEKQEPKEKTENQEEEKIIIVKVLPFYDEKLLQAENYRRFQDFLFPEQSIAKNTTQSKVRFPKDIAYDDSLLYIYLDVQGNIKLNMENKGNISNTKEITEILKQLFQEREKAGVYEPGNWKVVKAVGVCTDKAVKYRDFFKVVEAVEQSGAEPIVLKFDDDAGTLRTPIKNNQILKVTKNKLHSY